MTFDWYYTYLLNISIYVCSVLFNENKPSEIFKKNMITGLTVGAIACIMYHYFEKTCWFFSFEQGQSLWTGLLGVSFIVILTVLASLIGIVLWYLKSNIIKVMKLKGSTAKIIFTTLLCSFLIIEGLIWHSDDLKENYRVKCIIVLGSGLQGDQVSPTLRNRLDTCLKYLKTYPDTNIIVSGGQGRDESISEAEAMKRYLVSNGVDVNQIIIEDKSTNTYENMLFSKKILERKVDLDQDNILIITSDFHMFRAKLLAWRAGIPFTIGICAPSTIDWKIYYYFREYFVVIKSLIWDML